MDYGMLVRILRNHFVYYYYLYGKCETGNKPTYNIDRKHRFYEILGR